jgi:hypothetical protein
MLLPHTLDEVRTRETTHVTTVGRPNRWWPGGMQTNDCVGFQTAQLGLRTGSEVLGDPDRFSLTTRKLKWLAAHPHMISIAAFRAHYQWPEVPARSIRAGDLVISNWSGFRLDGELEPEHMEWSYSVAQDHDSLVIVGANTGPRPGDPTPNGVWKKSRPIDGHILFGIRPPYKDEKPSLTRKHLVKVVAGYTNRQDLGSIPTSSAAGPGKETGLEGPKYWRRVQAWGRRHGYYPSRFVIDGIPGPQSRIVEAAAYKAATAKR